MNREFRLIIIIIFIFCSKFSFAQSKIEILGAQRAEILVSSKLKKLVGDVKFRQNDVTLFCDSAYLNENKNEIEAFGNVRINQADSIFLNGDYLNYQGNDKTARVERNVVLTDGEMTLYTPRLDYNLKTKIGYYQDSGRIINNENTLTSKTGSFDGNNKMLYFRKNVVLVNPQYSMNSDTLQYHYPTEIAYFFGPTFIKGKDALVYCENGWYNTRIDYSQFSLNSYIKTEDKILKADSMVYTGKTGIDQAFRNIILIDTIQKTEVRGNRGTYYRKLNKTIITQDAIAQVKVEKDTLYLGADTLLTTYDSLEKNRKIYAYHHVKTFKTDLQTSSDSIFYSLKDSVMFLEGNPIIWTDSNQISGDSVRIILKEGKVKELQIRKNAFICSRLDSTKYNQIKGRDLDGFFENNALRVVEIWGNGEALYFIEEDSGFYSGVYRVNCSNIKIWIDSNKVEKVTFYEKPNAEVIPIDQINIYDTRLKGFLWVDKKRPRKKEDVKVKK